MALQKYDVPDHLSRNGGFLERYWSPINVPILRSDGSVALILHRVENVTDFVNDVLRSSGASKVQSAKWLESESELIRRSRQLSNANTELRRVSEEALALAARLKDDSERKDEFLAMLGHELRNPLAGVASAFELIRRSDANASVPPEIVAVVHRQITTLTRLVDDLLDASRVSRGAIELKRDVVDLRMVVETAAYSVRRDFEIKRHTLNINISPGDYSLIGDDARLQQVVANLLANAVKYTDAGGEIEVRLKAECSKSSRRARLTVSDNGRGIPAEYLETIIELFSQVNTTVDRSEGPGDRAESGATISRTAWRNDPGAVAR
ncbi:HAMP domain-containing sensor histidine kinase [Caballeronia sp. LZ016]|nr:HAMP domain-containing sensor histidine kinase [Caballeronia sp. LZ016]MDR5740165.1 HAMP domain-containing sensor histidine kinase [Caballeronia sp. LZ016]